MTKKSNNKKKKAKESASVPTTMTVAEEKMHVGKKAPPLIEDLNG